MPPTPTAEQEPAPPPEPSVADERPTHLSRPVVALIVGVAVLVLVGGLLVSQRDRTSEPWAGTVLGTPQDKPDIVLTDTDGNPFDLQAETEGQTTILMFGYTSCPDICPINVATLASALDGLDRSLGQSLRFVFVTVDPARDTPEVLRAYLDKFDRRFVGLTGTPDELVAAQEAAGVPVAADDPRADDGSYTVGHASQMILYQPDGVARIVYPFGTRQSDWSRDLPRLLAGEEPA